MKYKHTIYLPRHDNELSHLSYVYAEDIQKRMTDSFTTIFGGCTVHRLVEGCYKMSDGKIAYDSLTLIVVITDTNNIEGVIAHFINDIKTKLKQESVLYTVEEYTNVVFL